MRQEARRVPTTLDNIQRVRILVVEDERKLAQVLASALQAAHYDVVVAPNGEDGFFRAEVFDCRLRRGDREYPRRSRSDDHPRRHAAAPFARRRGHDPLSQEPANLGNLAGEAASSLSVLAEERNQTVKLDIGQSVIVPVDRLVLREALTNVLDNAIKYRPRHRVPDCPARCAG